MPTEKKVIDGTTEEKELSILDFFPEEPQFWVTSRKKHYNFRVANLSDRDFFRKTIGAESVINTALQDMDWDIISRLAYRLLIEKNEFLAEEKSEIDDDGIMKRFMLTGPGVLMRSITDLQEAIKMVGALTTALQRGDALVDKFVKETLKDRQEAEKKSRKNTGNLTGQKSMTP